MGSDSPGTLQAALARNLRALRRAQGQTQKDLATAAGVDQSFVSLIERGQRDVTLATVDAFAAALRVPALALLGGPR